MEELILNFDDNNITTIYNEYIDLSSIGKLSISRASYVEPDNDGNWYADLSPITSIRLGPFKLRSEALKAERQWLNNYLMKN